MDYIVGFIETEFDAVSNFKINLFCHFDLIGCMAFLKSYVQI